MSAELAKVRRRLSAGARDTEPAPEPAWEAFVPESRGQHVRGGSRKAFRPLAPRSNRHGITAGKHAGTSHLRRPR